MGAGLFAARPIRRRARPFCPCAGSRYRRDDPIHDSERGANLLQTGYRTYVLLEPPAVFANHSCDPNAGVVDSRRLVALRDIAPGQEIRFDYSTTMDENFWTMRCRCGVPGCRGTIGDFQALPPEVRRRYLDLGVVPRFIAWRYVAGIARPDGVPAAVPSCPSAFRRPGGLRGPANSPPGVPGSGSATLLSTRGPDRVPCAEGPGPPRPGPRNRLEPVASAEGPAADPGKVES